MDIQAKGRKDRKMTRKEELLQVVGDNSVLIRLVDDMVFLEAQLDQLRAYPMIKVDPENPARQKATPASRQYKEFLQQYVNVVKVIQKKMGAEGAEDASPLMKWLNAHEVECR